MKTKTFFYFKLTLRSSHDEKQIDLLNTTKLELEERQTNLQKQLEQKDTDINELNIRLNEQNAELQSLKTDKQVLEQQIVARISINCYCYFIFLLFLLGRFKKYK